MDTHKLSWFFLPALAALALAFSSCEISPPEFTPAAPGGLRAYADSETVVKLHWNNVFGTSEYMLYRSAKLNGSFGPFEEIQTLTGTSYTDAGRIKNTIYRYKIAARNNTGTSSQSAAVQCRTPDTDAGDTAFWAADLTAEGSFYKTWAKKAKTGQHCIVYAEISDYTNNAPEINSELAGKIANEFDNNIYGKITGAFGAPRDVDSNNKVILLMLDIQDGYDGKTSNAYTAGFFYEIDMLLNDEHSNKADMLYIDTWPAKVGISENMSQTYSTMAHELQHLINFSLHRGASPGKNAMDLWIDEGLASAAEYIYGGSQKDRIEYFKQDPFGSIVQGNNFFVWEDEWIDDILANYATDYLFFQWLRIHASNDVEIYKNIINSSETDYRAVTQAASSRINNSLSDWNTLLSTWYAANLICSNNANKYVGYKGQIRYNDLNTKELPNDYRKTHHWNLAPGEGVFSPLASSLTLPSGAPYGNNIRYAVINKTAETINSAPPASGGNYLLTFNTNTNSTSNSNSEIGYVTNIELSEDTARAALPSGEAYTPPQLYEWDGARYFFDRNKPKLPLKGRK
ncbi:fibronectin type III domain-containing protein [Leadbettera azotonutricia]|uniref:Fibronectin type III domain protein n=1 Tax=Leadbettera azotonutricia (strain ATCC BAA-888 / DSM 13862 / ZAS-9) TaxID=545695 RepID=F5YC24_LEAAZ|nr:fibronectin type III domain-containing protein [Leadbettera azotonutricia]AEF82348.1 fibronectin type III domain protein [Leadbettera azotonutricia ZAS-9]